MRQTAAILLITIFSFNIFGYRILYNYLANKADIRLELTLDKEDYDDADLISIKQATNLPYYNNSENFERIYGEVNFNGTIYKYVKCRIFKDSLEMLCIPHTAKMKIKSSEKDFFKHTNDFQQGANNKKNDSEQKNCKLTVSEFEELQDKILHNFCIQLKSPFFFNNDSLEPQAFIKSAERPPDFLSNTSVC